MASDFLKLIEKAKLRIPSGASFTGDLPERIRQLRILGEEKFAQLSSVLPGDYVRGPSNGDEGISLAAPIGYDIWYLILSENVLDFEDSVRTEEILERLDPFLTKLQGIKPLKTLRSIADLSFHDWWSWPSSMSYWTNAAPYMIKEMRFETVLEGKGFKYYSSGMPNGSVGYLAFPVGQLGVMEIISLIGESVTEGSSFSVGGSEAIKEGNEMMAPTHDNRGYCVGTHLVKNGYLAQNEVELMADEFEGQEPAEPHRWLRYWIMPDGTFPVPGEFVALLAKPELFHVWWFQETYPFLYSGQYWETEYYTSGIIKEIIEQEEGEANVYRVWVRSFEMYLRPSDFAGYEIDERVAIVKNFSDLTDNMDWTGLVESGKNNDSSSASSPDSDWCIVPISFYD